MDFDLLGSVDSLVEQLTSASFGRHLLIACLIECTCPGAGHCGCNSSARSKTVAHIQCSERALAGIHAGLGVLRSCTAT